MRFGDVLATAITQIRANKLRSFFTLLGVIVSVAFLVAVVAVIQGMNAYVKESVADALIGSNTFQIRRLPINIALIEDADWLRMQRRPKLNAWDVDFVRKAIPDAAGISVQSGFPTPRSDVVYGNKTLGSVQVFGVTPEYQTIQDYKFQYGEGLTEIDTRERRYVAVVGADIVDKLFNGINPVGRSVHVHGIPITIIGTIMPKGKVLGQSFDGFVMLPITTFESMYGRRQSNTISVKMTEAKDVAPAMQAAEEAMRVAHRLRPNDQNNFSIETADALANRSAAPIPAKPGVHTSQSTDDVSKKWSVQISAVPGKAVADTLIERLKASGYDTYGVKAEVKGQTYYRVRVGHFDAREEAESVRQSLASQEGYRDAYLTSD